VTGYTALPGLAMSLDGVPSAVADPRKKLEPQMNANERKQFFGP
jgi:hypothetical protein